MKILHVIATMAPRDGGPSKACFEMARAAARRGHDVTIFTTNKDGAGELDVPTGRVIERDGVRLRYFPITSPRFFGTSWAMAQALREEIPNADVVHLHSLYMFHDWVVGKQCTLAGVPYILRPHGSLDPYLYQRHRWRKTIIELCFQNCVTRNAAALHFTTEEEKVLAAPYSLGVSGFVVPNGVETDEYETLPQHGTFRSKHPEIGDNLIILFLGRLNFKKGLDILIPAFATALRQVPEAHLVLAGPDDGMRAQTENWVREHEIADHVHFLGMVEGEEKLALLADSNLFVLPSYSENFGIAVVEAMACGLPVVISDRVNIWREVAEADAGWVASPEVGPFVDAIISALLDPKMAQERGTRARDMVHKNYRWPEIAKQLEAAYTSVVEGPQPPANSP